MVQDYAGLSPAAPIQAQEVPVSLAMGMSLYMAMLGHLLAHWAG